MTLSSIKSIFSETQENNLHRGCLFLSDHSFNQKANLKLNPAAFLIHAVLFFSLDLWLGFSDKNLTWMIKFMTAICKCQMIH